MQKTCQNFFSNYLFILSEFIILLEYWPLYQTNIVSFDKFSATKL